MYARNKKMKKILKLILFIFLTTNQILGQIDENFVGIIRTSTNDVFTYKISYQLSNDGKIKGESITDFSGKDKTISKIEGSLNSKKSELNFKENQIIKTISNSKEFCFIQANKLEIKEKNGKKIIQGKFEADYPNGKPCLIGYMYLVSDKKIESELKKSQNFDSIIKNYISTNSMILNSINNKTTIDWKSKEINGVIFDSSIDDNDIIDITYNGKSLLNDYAIKKEKKIISFTLVKDAKFILTAQNEGNEGKNTVSILFTNGNEIIPVTTILKKGENIEIVFK